MTSSTWIWVVCLTLSIILESLGYMLYLRRRREKTEQTHFNSFDDQKDDPDVVEAINDLNALFPAGYLSPPLPIHTLSRSQLEAIRDDRVLINNRSYDIVYKGQRISRPSSQDMQYSPLSQMLAKFNYRFISYQVEEIADSSDKVGCTLRYSTDTHEVRTLRLIVPLLHSYTLHLSNDENLMMKIYAAFERAIAVESFKVTEKRNLEVI